MLKRFLLLNMLLPALAVLPGTQAEAGDLTIAGKIIAASCTVSPLISGGQEVNLGTVGRTKFQRANDVGEWKSFSLNLTGCPTGTTETTVQFTGTAAGTDSSLFANTEPAATAATNIAVQLAKDADHDLVLSNGSTMTVNVDNATKTATFPLAARLYSPSGNAQPGQVSSSVMVNFTYQ